MKRSLKDYSEQEKNQLFDYCLNRTGSLERAANELKIDFEELIELKRSEWWREKYREYIRKEGLW